MVFLRSEEEKIMSKKQLYFKRTMMASAVALCMTGISAFAADTDADSVDVEKLFKEGVYQREQGNLFTSIEALQTVLSNQPALHRARLELAVSYYRTLNFEAAKQQAQTVLDDPKTPPNVRIAVLAFMAQVKKDEEAMLAQRQVWTPSVSLGLLYDTNVNAGPSSDVLPGGLVLAPGSRPKDDTAAVLQAGVSHRYNSPTVMRIGESAARFIWQSQLNLFHRGYFKESDYNLSALTLATGPGWLVPNKWRANINLQLDDIWLGGEEIALYSSLNPSVTWEIKEGEITWDAIALNKDFTRGVDQGRDSNYYATGLSVGKMFKGGKVAVQGGVRVFDEQADVSRFSNDGTEFFVGGNFVAWNNGNVYARYSQKDAKFDGVEPVYNVARDETEERYEVGFGHNFKEGLMKNWKLSGSYIESHNNSNVSIYNYDREMTSVNLSRAF